MKTSDKLRAAFKKLEGGKNWVGGGALLSCGTNCAMTATWDVVEVSDSPAERYLIAALPAWARKNNRWGDVAHYNDDPRCEFRHISALYGKAIKLAEIDEAESAGLVGKARLLRVALALREARNPKFDMHVFFHFCGTPACAFGHYVTRTDLQSAFVVRHIGGVGTWCALASGSDVRSNLTVETQHFEITNAEWSTLFSMAGCGGAKTAIQAADFIEKFAHAKWSTP